jgi:hypothetical protein
MHNIIGFKLIGLFRVEFWIWSDGNESPIYSIGIRHIKQAGDTIGEREILVPLNADYDEATESYNSLTSVEKIEQFVIENG